MPMSTCPVNFTSAHLRSPEMLSPTFPEFQDGSSQISGFSQDIFQSSRLNKSRFPPPPPSPLSPWPYNTNALQIRDPNQQNAFNSNLIIHKNNEIAIKLKDTCKSNPLGNTPTWSQIAAGNSCLNSNSLVSSRSATTAINTNKKKLPMVNKECSASESLLSKEDMDIDIQEPSTSSPLASTKIPSVAARESKFISDSLAFITSGVNDNQNISVPRLYTILKIKNVFVSSFF